MRLKNRWHTGILILLALSVISNSPALAEEKTMLSLQECIELALENHPGIQAAGFQLVEAQLELEKLQLEDPRQVAERALAEREQAFASAQQALEETRMRLGLEVESGYYQLLKTIETLKSKEEALEWTKRQLSIVQIKYESGMIPAKDYSAMQDKLVEAEKALASMQYNYETARMEFNLVMGLDLDYAFELIETEFPFEPVEITLEEALAYALLHADSIRQASAAVDEARAALELKRANGVSRVELLKAEHSLIKAENALKEAEKQMVITIRGAHMGLRSGHDQVISARKRCAEAESALEVIRIKYAAGMISLLEMMSAHRSLQEAEVLAIQAIYDYNLARASFYRTIGRGYSPYVQGKAENQGSDQ